MEVPATTKTVLIDDSFPSRRSLIVRLSRNQMSAGRRLKAAACWLEPLPLVWGSRNRAIARV
jgi:hypothetical protein